MNLPSGDYIRPAILLGALGVTVYIYYKRRIKDRLPQNWKQVGTLKDLLIYPVKSCRSVRLNKAECNLIGLKHGWLRDRILMVTNDKNEFITARDYPKLLSIQPTIKGSTLTLEHASVESLDIDLLKISERKTAEIAQIWKVPVPVYDCGIQSQEWLTRLLQRNSEDRELRLVCYASGDSSQLRPKKSNKVFKFRKNDAGALQDEASYNLINEASIEDLNTRLTNCKITAGNFRPNFVMRSAEPYEEDNWNFVKIGENIFEIVKPCIRCTITTMDPETGERNSESEPLRTLRRYREISDPVIRAAVVGSTSRMGVHMALRSPPGGLVQLNDPVYVA